MSNEEKFIVDRVGRENPFRVPEGYFDQLSASIMQKLPEQRSRSRVVRLRPWYVAAACLTLFVVMGGSYLLHQESSAPVAAVYAETNTENSYIDDAADYAMLDNTEIYACLADN